ncbi:autotransporter outer membrane beta-barrel domain-containing protein [Paraburkholderia sp. GAS448]|uniref:autotransporter family protein n=1 Tax=Paraburkholderia sp. GAS448 TaxID=3035136 RepID=UPI003D23BC5A
MGLGNASIGSAGNVNAGGTGGNGGGGSTSGSAGGSGGSGGDGGVGISGNNVAITSDGMISGGDGGRGGGGAGGAGAYGSGGGPGGAGGKGGNGGGGIVGDNLTITNTGTISGGNGGGGGSAGSGGSGISAAGSPGGSGGIAGNGGIGITGSNLTIINSGGISGGLSGISGANGTTGGQGPAPSTGGVGGNSGATGTGSVRANAIAFTGGVNSLELRAGSTITGTVGNAAGVTGTTNTLIWGGSDSASFDVSSIGQAAQYQDFVSYQKTGSSTWTLTGESSYSGNTTITAGTLAAGGANVFSPNSDYAVQAAGTLDLQGNSQTVASLSNAGLFNMGTGTAPGAVLTTRSYVGQGGTLALNTYLGADNSPSDQLVINGGTATGTTTLAVTNVGGPGAQTTANGIAVVQTINGATTAAGTFTQAAGELRGGAFDYRLFQGGLGGSDPSDWFLRSTFVVPPSTPTEPTEPPVTPPDELPPVSPPAGGPPAQPGTFPIIGPEIATYSVVQPAARQLGLTTLGTLHERIGDTLTEADGGAGNDGWGHSGWARIFGQQIDNRYQTFADARASGKQVGFQAGVDLWRGSFLPGHHDAAGVYYAYGNSSVDVDGLVTNAAATGYVMSHTGSLDLDAYSGGAYWTHYGPGGWYVDAVFQGTYYDGQATTQFARLPVSGSGFATSLEAGYPIPLPLGPGFVLEPQAQVIWQHVGLNEENDGLGAVDPGSTSGVSGRLGVRGQWTITGANGQVWQPYVRANLWRDWGAQATTTYSGVDQVPVIGQATRMDVAAGVTASIDTHMKVYSQFGYQFSVNSSASGSRKGVWGDVGVRYLW